jgi:TolA-binding protein
MLGISSSFKAVAIVVGLISVLFGLWYVTGLRADLAVSQENSKKLTEAVEQQQQVLKEVQKDQQKIRDINTELNTTIKLQDKDLDNLKDKFTSSQNGQQRDLGKSASARPARIEAVVNKATENATRCLEIASGAPLTEAEKNATKIDQINKECPGIANPNYSSK